MGMGAQNRGATGAPAPTQMAMQGGAAPQGLMALMQQRGKGAGMPGGMPQGGPGMGKPDPQLLAAMQAFQQQGGQGGMPPNGTMGPPPGALVSQPAPGKGGGLPPGIAAPGGMPMPKMPGIIGMPGGAGGKGAGLPPGLNRPMPMPPGNMGNPPPFKIMPKPAPRPQPVRPKEFGGFR